MDFVGLCKKSLGMVGQGQSVSVRQFFYNRTSLDRVKKEWVETAELLDFMRV